MPENKEDEENKDAEAEEAADEDGADEGADEKEDSSSEDKENSEEKEDDGADGEGDEDEGPFENLDLRGAVCFGWERDASQKCWYNKCLLAKKFGWNNADKEGIELSLKDNVDKCYSCIATFDFINLDDDTPYRAEFDNNKMMWKLSIKDSPKAEIQMEEIGDFFKSELMKRCAQRAADLVQRSVDMYHEVLEARLQNGELLAVDEVKLAAILHEAHVEMFMENLRGCKWYTS